MISWETFFPRRVREAIDNDAQIVLNPTNGSSYWLTQVQTQQIASSSLRAVESGRWLLQSAPTGFSAIIDQRGKVHRRSGVGEAKVLQQQVELRDGTTLAMFWGEVPALALSAAAIAAAWRPGRRREHGQAGSTTGTPSDPPPTTDPFHSTEVDANVAGLAAPIPTRKRIAGVAFIRRSRE